MTEIIPIEIIQQKILIIRGFRVMLDADLAAIYGVTTKRLNEQVKRNSDRFPQDFMFQLSDKEYKLLRSQIATLKQGRGRHRKYLPYVFSEHGAIMLANVLNSPAAVEASIQVVRAFVKLREVLLNHKQLASKLNQLERKIGEHDKGIHTIFEALRQLMTPPVKNKHKIGFNRE